MAKLTSRERNRLPNSSFAGPNRSFPVEDRSHARNALARVANKAPDVKAEVRRAVDRRYPGLIQKDKRGS